jgi:hypothetical protein
MSGKWAKKVQQGGINEISNESPNGSLKKTATEFMYVLSGVL